MSEEFERTLRDWANGQLTCEAATELLIRTGLAEQGLPWVEPDGWIDFEKIADNVGTLSGEQQRILRIAASIFGAQEITLGDHITGIDRIHLELVLAAIAHAHGEASDIVTHPGGGVSFGKLGQAFPWP